MYYYYINTNTEADESAQGNPQKWIDCGYAFTSGDYEEYGERKLGKLNPGDILFMYVNEVGVVAVGEVLKHWDKKKHKAERLVDREYPEYRIPVEWFIRLVNKPIEKEVLKKIFGSDSGRWYPRKTLRRLENEKAKKLLKEAHIRDVCLEKVHIKNYRSLRDVELPLKPLTVIVGPNASGKSNIVNGLALLNNLMVFEKPPSMKAIQESLWAGGASNLTFQLQAKVGGTPAVYDLVLQAGADNVVVSEELLVEDKKVISIQNGAGIVLDDNATNTTKYEANRPALRSAGDYENKPITNALAEFIKEWHYYDFQPFTIRNNLAHFSPVTKELPEPMALDSYGARLPELLSDWYQNTPEVFHKVSESLASSTNIKIDQRTIDGNDQLCLWEGYNDPIPMWSASNGTLRLVAHYALLNQSELAPLMVIEEPDQHLHPRALKHIANALEQLAEQTQVIITTHSSQLLDIFTRENDSLGVLLLHNRFGDGTEVINIEDIRGDRPALEGWITDFGVGSAIFESEILQDLTEE